MSIRVGIIGLNRGGRFHLPLFKHDHRLEVVALCARTPGVAEELAQLHNVPQAFTDVREFMQADFDLVSIATPPATHARMAAAAMALGKHVLVETPMVTTLADARVLRDVMFERKRLGVVTNLLRYVPNLRYVSDLLQQKAIGRPFLMRFDYFSNFMAMGAGAKWLWEPALGGGVLVGFAAHAFDLARHWLGPVKEVDSTLATYDTHVHTATPGRPLAEDTGTVTFHYESGALAFFNFSAVASTSRVHVELHGSEASLLIDGFGDSLALIKLDEAEAVPVYPPATYLEEVRGEVGLAGGFTILLDEVVEVLQNNHLSPLLPTFLDGLETLRLVEAARLAAREKRRVSVSEVA